MAVRKSSSSTKPMLMFITCLAFLVIITFFLNHSCPSTFGEVQSRSESDLVVKLPSRSFFAGWLWDFSSFEEEVWNKIRMTETEYFIQKRFPIPQIPVHVVDTRRGCIMGDSFCSTLKKKKWMWADPHVRDIVASSLLHCKFKEEPCHAIDIGANFGLHTLTMLLLNTKVTSVEPQPDLCASLMTSVAGIGMTHMSTVRCGLMATQTQVTTGIAPDHREVFDSARAYHYDGPVKITFSYEFYGLRSGVPLISMAEILPPKDSTLDLVKIDTDLIDCDLLDQLFERIRNKELRVKNIVFESTGCEMPWRILEARNLNFTVYRTCLQELQFDEKGSPPKTGKAFTKPAIVDEVFEIRFNRYLWKFHTNATIGQLTKLLKGTFWQYYMTTEVKKSNPMKI